MKTFSFWIIFYESAYILNFIRENVFIAAALKNTWQTPQSEGTENRTRKSGVKN